MLPFPMATSGNSSDFKEIPVWSRLSSTTCVLHNVSSTPNQSQFLPVKREFFLPTVAKVFAHLTVGFSWFSVYRCRSDMSHLLLKHQEICDIHTIYATVTNLCFSGAEAGVSVIEEHDVTSCMKSGVSNRCYSLCAKP